MAKLALFHLLTTLVAESLALNRKATLRRGEITPETPTKGDPQNPRRKQKQNPFLSAVGHALTDRGQIVEELEDWEDKHLALSSKSLPKVRPKIEELMSPAAWESTLKSLIGAAPSRNVFNESGSKQVQSFIEDHMRTSGLEVTKQFFGIRTFPGGEFTNQAKNIIGEIKGSLKPDTFVVMGAHYDTLPTGPFAPGADDNGSGAACLLLAARTLIQSGFKPKRTVRFVAFTGEEQGLKGSDFFVKKMTRTETDNFHGAVIMDQVGFTRDPNRTSVILETSGREAAKQRVIDTMGHAIRDIPVWGDNVYLQVNYHGWGSDHMSFLNQGLPAVLLIERDNLYAANQFGHTVKDNLDNINFEFGAKMCRIAAESLFVLADPDLKKPALRNNPLVGTSQ